MNTLTRHQQWLVAGILLLAMVLTRSHLVNHIQDASWAIFFMVGFYLRNKFSFPAFFLAAFAIDLVVIDAQGGQHYCFTPAYPFLIPAYAAMWGAGRWLANHYQENAKGLLQFAGSAVVGVTVCFAISNAGFYFFSEHFETNLIEHASQIAKYLPMYLQTTALYLSIAAVVHLAVVHANRLSGTAKES